MGLALGNSILQRALDAILMARGDVDGCSPWVNPETASSARYHPPRPDLSLGIERESPYRFVRVN